jgi:sulfur-oxidizing protein SoxX
MASARKAFILLGTAALLASCGLIAPSPAELDAQAGAVINASFRTQGIATVDRLRQDLAQSACSGPQAPDDDTAQRIREQAQQSIRWPAGGQYFGDWAAGERIAQSGRGMTWSDVSADPAANGGNCYNCHQIDQKELSHGTLGPSLWNYGKDRGIRDLQAPTAAPIIQYTWSKLWNSHAYLACSSMPRFGQQKLLNEEQIRHLMSLLLDPRSPVNR